MSGPLFVPAAVLLVLSAVSAAGPKAENYVISPAASKIKVDGVLDEEAWQNATVIRLPYEWTPGDNAPAPVETECLVTFDRDRFFIGFRCFDPKPGEIRAHLMDRDASDTLIQDDHISVIIDAFNDERRGFQKHLLRFHLMSSLRRANTRPNWSP